MRSSAQHPTAKPAAAEVAERKKRLHRLSLVLHPDPVLRTVCPPVVRFDSTLRDLLAGDARFDDRARWDRAGRTPGGHQTTAPVCRIGERSLRLMNPEVRAAGTSGLLTEGCLSLPDTLVTVLRPERIEVKGYDDRGCRRSFSATGLWARVIQHERDHLNGVLILDHGPPLTEEESAVSSGSPASLMEAPL
jgi:peptide deformylase